MGSVVGDFEGCYRAAESRDARFDGWFFTAVTSTGTYCRPSCPAVTPRRENVRFYRTAAAAQLAGFRACKRCRPDATPGSPEWNARRDLVGRAMRLIADGVVDRSGVSGLAGRLHVSVRHLHRLLVDEVGAGPLALARAQRAQTARVLVETTELPFAEVAFGAGFASIRQFNDTVREVFASSPTDLRRKARRVTPAAPGALMLRLPYRPPLDAGTLFGFLAARAVPGIEEATADGGYRRTLRLPNGWGVAELRPADGHIACTLRLSDLRDLGAAVARCRRLLDLDADPVSVGTHLDADPALGSLLRRRPGLRVPGHVDGAELAIRAVLGQQVSVPAAATHAGRMVRDCGEPLPAPDGALTHLFPTPGAIATVDPALFKMPATRRATIARLAGALAAGEIRIDPGADREELGRRLQGIGGIGPWTAAYVALRALGDPDVFLPTDLGVKQALLKLGHPAEPRAATALAESWRPWRSYATIHLWASLSDDGRPPERMEAT
jgi:AraC family transcriptional regulator, regulatory protein of adaptative response / DNA-3-methyladenine glycosylase II